MIHPIALMSLLKKIGNFVNLFSQSETFGVYKIFQNQSIYWQSIKVMQSWMCISVKIFKFQKQFGYEHLDFFGNSLWQNNNSKVFPNLNYLKIFVKMQVQQLAKLPKMANSSLEKAEIYCVSKLANLSEEKSTQPRD